MIKAERDLRDRFAAMAMHATMLDLEQQADWETDHGHEECLRLTAAQAYAMADAMLAWRKK